LFVIFYPTLEGFAFLTGPKAWRYVWLSRRWINASFYTMAGVFFHPPLFI
jgi:hypothetical protein